MIAGIVLVAFGLKTTLAHVDEPSAPSRPSPCSAAPRCTCWPTSPSGCG